MSTRPYEGVELDFCDACSGLWFDGDELAKALGKTADDVDLAVSASLRKQTKRACPRCKLQLVELRLTGTSIAVDHCNRCSGVFLDRGELDKARRQLRRRQPERRPVRQSESPAPIEPRHLDAGSSGVVLFQFLTDLPVKLGSTAPLSPAVLAIVAMNILMFVVAMQFVFSSLSLSGIAWWAHIGGFAAGIAIALGARMSGRVAAGA